MNVWLDADFSGLVWSGLDCDDDLALLVLLAEQTKSSGVNLVGVSVCGGNAPLSHAWKNIQALQKYIDFSFLHQKAFVVPQKGYGWRSMQVSRPWLRLLHAMAPDLEDSEDAVDALIEFATTTQESSSGFSILTLGPPTNVARALEKLTNQPNSPLESIDHVYMMGGELTGQRLDMNFVSDRAAARSIINNPVVPKTLVTIQLCAQVVMDDAFVDKFERRCCHGTTTPAAACAILPKMKQQVLLMPRYINPSILQRFPTHNSSRWTFSPNIYKGFIPWDVLAVLVMTRPELFDDYEYHRVALPSCVEGEPCDKTMTVLESLGSTLLDNSNHSGIVRIPHKVINETLVTETMHNLLCQVPAVQGEPLPSMMLGFFTQLIGIVVTIVVILFSAFCFQRKQTKFISKLK